MSRIERIFESRPLPRYFAVLRPTSGGSPSYQICQTEICSLLYQGMCVPVSVVKNAELSNETLSSFKRRELEISEDETLHYTEGIVEYKMRNEDQPDEYIRTVRYWFQHHYFFWNEYHIPILDFNKRFFLTRSFHRVIPVGLTTEQIREDLRVLYQRKRTQYMVLLREIGIRGSEDSEETEETSQKIPKFVLDLLVKDQIQKNNSCSITMSPFRTITNIGVTPCFHLFDLNAIQRWVSEHKKCPVCRNQVEQIQEYIHQQSLQ